MNKEQHELVDEAYANYEKEIIRQRQIQEKKVNRLRSEGKRLKVSLIELLIQDEFIKECKTDDKFSKTWGLKIEERELSLEERRKILEEIHPLYYMEQQLGGEDILTRNNIPTHQITVTYKDKTIESYE
jgi:3-deoxy-D-arabino-heptulosonate 7-phosphate (DAHP) synthase